MDAEKIKELRTAHEGSYKTLFNIYQNDKKFYDTLYFWLPLLGAIIFSVVGLIIKMNFYEFLTGSLISTVFTIIPCLLGFNLGGFILVVGFASSDLLKIVAKPLVNQKNYSFYQKNLSVLGTSVFIQAITLSLGFIVYLISSIHISSDCFLGDFFNVLAVFLVSFFMLYSLSQLFVVVKHVFMFAQTIHFKVVVQLLNEDEKKNDDSSAN